MADYIAVYGSLRRGMQAECKMQRMEFVGQGEIPAALYALGWYPGVKFDGSPNSTIGEIFKLPEDSLLREAILWDLDGYEGYSPESPQNSLFVRKIVPVKVEGQSDISCYVYEYNYPVNRAPLVENGDWVAFQGEKEKAR